MIVPWEIYRSYGDRDLLDRQWPSMVALMERAITMAKTGRHPDRARSRPVPRPHEEFLWDTGFHLGEWLEPGVQVGWDELFTMDQSQVATAYLHFSAGLMAQIATVRNDSEAAARYGTVADGAADAWQQEFITPDGVVLGESQATLVRALAFGLIPEKHRARAAARLVELIKGAGTHLATGFLATPYLLPVLADSGHLELAYELLFQDTAPSWLAMLDRGATTIWELWEGVDEHGNAHESLNHYSKGAVISFLHRYTAGIQALDEGPGYSKFRVAPRPGGGLIWAEATHDSPYGPIESSWRIHGPLTRLTVRVPPGTTADVVLPDGRSAQVGPGQALFEWPTLKD